MKFIIIIVCCLLIGWSPHSIAKENSILFVTSPYPPFSGKDLPNQGFLVELTKQSMNKVGYNVAIRFAPWARAVKLVESGEADAVIGAYFTKERTIFGLYSLPLFTSRDILLVRKDSDVPKRIKNLEELDHYSIDVVRGNSHGPAFDNSELLYITNSNTYIQSINKLLKKRVDIIAIPEPSAIYVMNHHFTNQKNQLQKISPPLSSNATYALFSKKSPNAKQYVDDFNTGLEMLKQDGTYDKIMRAAGFANYHIDIQGTPEDKGAQPLIEATPWIL
ncbi:transporter substrate-binding domain-containing protein [Vibrio profundum]|uniref:substrate-binding periplasmic protein n=1 Tax=Vibrio profundum TaxID=2910247 RepID=UPI003D11B3DF